MTARRHKIRTRRSNFRWNTTEKWILVMWLSSPRVWSRENFIQLCAALGRSPRSVLEKGREHCPEWLDGLPFTVKEIYDMSEDLAITTRQKDHSIKWDRRPRKKDTGKIRFTTVATGRK